MTKRIGKDRFYWNGTRYVPSGTTVLPRPDLKQWAADCAVDYVENVWDNEKYTSQWLLEGDFLKARTAYQRKGMEAAHYGTFIHWMCQRYLETGEPEPIPAEFTITEDDGETCVIQIDVELTKKFMEGFSYKTKGGKIKYTDGFYNWCKVHNVKPIAIEHKVTTDLYGGRLDLVCEMDGVVTLVDFKTGKGTYYDTWPLQLAGYRNGWNSGVMNLAYNFDYIKIHGSLACKIQAHGILKFNKANGKINYKDFSSYERTRTNPETLEKEKYERNYETDLKTFMACCQLWWLVNRGMDK